MGSRPEGGARAEGDRFRDLRCLVDAGAAFLQRPFTTDALAQAVRDALDTRRRAA